MFLENSFHKIVLIKYVDHSVSVEYSDTGLHRFCHGRCKCGVCRPPYGGFFS